jgi:uncharacterized membrane protein YhaH (DUF805 family)
MKITGFLKQLLNYRGVYNRRQFFSNLMISVVAMTLPLSFASLFLQTPKISSYISIVIFCILFFLGVVVYTFGMIKRLRGLKKSLYYLMMGFNPLTCSIFMAYLWTFPNKKT